MNQPENLTTKNSATENSATENSTVIILVALTILAILLFYTFWFSGHPISKNPGDWGPFGDFFGGILNPLISGAGLFLVIKTLKQNELAIKQSKAAIYQNELALELSRDSLKQAEEMIEQGQSIIKTNAKELRESREEQRQSREAQQRLAEYEKENIERRLLESNQILYQNTITALKNKADSLASLKSAILSTGAKKFALNTLMAEAKPVTLRHGYELTYTVELYKQYINILTEAYKFIGTSGLVKNNPNKVTIAMTETYGLYGITLEALNFSEILEIQLDQNGYRTAKLIKNNPEFKLAIDELDNASKTLGILPLKK